MLFRSWLRHGEGYPDWSLRLFHREHANWSDDLVHETVVSRVAVERLDGDLLHDSAETLSGYLEKQNRYTSLAAQRLHQAVGTTLLGQQGQQLADPRVGADPHHAAAAVLGSGNELAGKRVGVILSGGNIDPARYTSLLSGERP